MIAFDHIAIAGEDLASARAYVEDALGVPLQPGGEHDVFHTHNALLGLEDGLYLEAIAINTNAPEPKRARWFDLDRFSGKPRMTNWICRTEALTAVLEELDLALGAPVALQRGDLRWRMAVPDDGILPFDNTCPALIQWDTPHHPANMLTRQGVRLRRLTVSHPDAKALSGHLNPVLNDDRIVFEIGAAGFEAAFDTPHGARVLS